MALLTISSILVSYIISLHFTNKKKVFLWLAGLSIIFIMGSRYFINGFTDEITYNYQYVGYKNWSFERLKKKIVEDRDWGFSLFYWTLAKIFPWNQFPIYFITAFFTFSSFRFIYYNTNEPLIAVLLIFAFGIFSFYMAGYRQCFAMCFCLLSFEYAKKRRFFPYLLLCLIAVSMHISAFIFLPIYWLLDIKSYKDDWRIWIVVIALMYIGSRFLLRYAADAFDREGYLVKEGFSLVGFFIQIVIMIIPLGLKLVGVCEDKAKHNLSKFLWITCIGLMFYALKLVYFSYERLSYYYTFFVIVSMSEVIFSLRKKDQNDQTNMIIKLLICLVLLILAIWRMPTNLTFFWEH